MRFRALIRLAALTTVFAGATLQEPRELFAADGCGYQCEALGFSECVDWGPNGEQECRELGQDGCEMYIEWNYGMDCVNACQIESSCGDGSTCTGGEVEWECEVWGIS